MDFDISRKGTGTAEWAEVTENICRGCRNDCLYCYAANSANRFNLRKREQWATEELTKRAEITSYPARNGVVMFPSSHDISPYNLEAYIRVAKLILERGNRLLIVSKPRLECVAAMIPAFSGFEDQILFRFTIGSMDKNTLKFWEPGAPGPMERLECLERTFLSGFNTSVSIEPIVGGIIDAIAVVEMVRIFVSETIWIGKMNKVRIRVDRAHAEAVREIELLQGDNEIMALYRHYKNDPIVRWKDSIKEVVSRMEAR